MYKNENITINVDDLIAICHIIDEIDEFNKELFNYLNANYLTGKNKKKRLHYLMKVCNKNNVYFKTSADKFYYANKKVIDTINVHQYFSNFLIRCYDNKGNLKENVNIMINYIKKNRSNIDKILDILNKLKKLNFYELAFNSSEKFDKTYTYDSYMFYYLDGELENVPSIVGNKYKSKNANYLIEMGVDFDYMPFVKLCPKITLNNLIFDKNLLPKELSYNETLRKIIKLNNSKDQKQLETSIKLMIDIENLEKDYKSINITIHNLDKELNNGLTKEQLIVELTKLHDTITQFKKISNNYNEEVKKNSSTITQELLNNEQKIYKKTNRKI